MKQQNRDLKPGARVAIANSVVAFGAAVAIRSAWSIEPITISTILLMLWGAVIVGVAIHHTITTAYRWSISDVTGVLMIVGVFVSAVVGIVFAVLPSIIFTALVLAVLTAIMSAIAIALFLISRRREANEAHPLYRRS